MYVHERVAKIGILAYEKVTTSNIDKVYKRVQFCDSTCMYSTAGV